MSLYNHKTTVQSWYGTSVAVPRINNQGFDKFATSCMGIAASMLGKKLDKRLHVGLSNQVSTAYADPDKNLIVVSRNFLSGDFRAIGQSDTQSSSATIGAILGVLVHEVGHFAYSPATLEPQVKFVQSHTTKIYSQSMAKRIANTVEDIFIEYEIAKNFPTLSWSLGEINQLMLTDALYKSSQTSLLNLHSIQSADDINNVCNYLLYAKVTNSSGKVSSLVKSLFDIARSATIANSLDKRCELTLKLYNAIMPSEQKKSDKKSDDNNAQDNDQSDDSQESDDTDDKESGKDDSSESDNSESDNGDKESDSNQSDSTSDDNKESGKDDYTEIAHSTGEIGDKESSSKEPVFTEINQSVTRQESDQSSIGFGRSITVEIVNVPLGKEIESDDRFAKLAEIASQRASVNRPYGLQHNSGRDMRNLHRIISDGKIFATRLPSETYKPMDVMIVLDCSDSMNWKTAGESKINLAAKATLGATIALLSGRCNIQVWGHTSKYGPRPQDFISTADVILYPLLQQSESPTLLSKRLGFLTNKSLSFKYLIVNRDGDALDQLSKKFNPSQRRKLMIVISDGQPNAENYEGWAAIDHTQKIVNQIRTSGIDVFSLSIDKDAFSPNNKIYGQDFNVCSEDPNAIDEMIRQIVLK